MKLKGIKKVQAQGKTKASILMESNLQIDIRVVPDYEYGASLQYFTGNKAHNILLRSIAINKNNRVKILGRKRKKEQPPG